METAHSPLEGSAKRGVGALDDMTIQTEEIHAYKWFEVEDILSLKPNIEAYDFMIEMLEKIVGEDEL